MRGGQSWLPTDAFRRYVRKLSCADGWLDLNGGGTLIVSGTANSYTGGTDIQGKSQITLAGGDNRLPTAGDIRIDAGTLDLGGCARRLPEPSRSTAISRPIPIPTRCRTAPSSLTTPAPSKALTLAAAPARSPNIVVQGSQPEEDWVLTSAYTLTIAANVDFTGYNLFQIGGNTVFDGASYTGDTFAVMGYTVRRTTIPATPRLTAATSRQPSRRRPATT